MSPRRCLGSFLLALSLFFVAALTGCSSDNSPTPAITSLSPGSANAGSAGFTLTVNGSGFSSDATVQWNGSARTTSFVSASQLTASITAADIASAGTVQVTVVSKGKTSNQSAFAISVPPNPVPAVTSLSPATAVAGSPAFQLTVNGSNFVSGATVQWDGAARTTTFVSSTQVRADITAADIASAGSKAISVANPSPGGGASNTVAFTITSPPPTLSSLSPATATAGGAAFTLTVNGTGFLSGAAVAWNGSPRPTTVVSSTQLTAAISAADIASAGSAAVDVAQGSLRSTNQLSFPITPAPPTITSVAPNSVSAGGAAFTLTVNGTGFASNAQVAWNGTSLSTTFVSATQLTAQVPAANIASSGSATVDVVQNNVRSSNQQSVTINAPAPVISSLSPSSVTVNAASFTLTVNGTGFTSSSVVQWNGTALTTSFQSATSLTASVPAGNLTAAGTFSITVVNPTAQGGASSAASFTVANPVAGKIVQLVSTSYVNGGVSNWTSNNSPPTLSRDGRYVGYASYSSDIVAGDNDGDTSGFLRDTCVGATASAGCVPRNTMVSTTDAVDYGAYRYVLLSTDGRYAGFDSRNQSEVNVRDTCIGAPSGCTSTITNVLELPGSLYPGSLYSYAAGNNPRMSPDGRYMMYSRIYFNPDSTATYGVWVRDNCIGVSSGCTTSLTRVATGKGATPVKSPFLSDLSAGGRYVLFRAPLTAVDPSLTADSGVNHVWLQDTCIGAAGGCKVSYTLIDVRADGTPSEGNLANAAISDEEPSFSLDARYVVFSTTDKNMISGRTINNGSQVYLRDTCIGAPNGCSPSTILISDWPNMASQFSKAYVGFRSISEHGRYVAFLHQGHRSGDVNGVDVFVRDTCIGAPSGCTPSTSMATNDPDGINPATVKNYQFPSISADGHYVAFMASGGQVYLALTGY